MSRDLEGALDLALTFIIERPWIILMAALIAWVFWPRDDDPRFGG